MILLLSLTGCQSIEKQREEQTKAHTYIVESHIEDYVWRDQTKWETLLNPLSKHNKTLRSHFNVYPVL